MVKVLVVDDEDLMRMVAIHALLGSDLGLIDGDVLGIGDPCRVERVLQENPYIVMILSDFMMPGMNGEDLHRLIAPTLRDRRITFSVATGTDRESAEAAYEYFDSVGVQVLRKPYSVEDLEAVVRAGLVLKT